MFFTCRVCDAQILCIYCYDQNDSLSDNVNNLLLNGGFENGTCIPNFPGSTFCPNSNNYSCDVTNWTCTGGGSLTYAKIVNDSNYTIIVEGIKAAYFGNNLAHACSPTANDTSCLNNLFCTLTSIPTGYPVNDTSFGGINGVSLEQTVNGLIVGNTYVLEFWAGGESGLGLLFPYTSLFAVDIGFGNTMFKCRATRPFTGIGIRYVIEFIATSSSHLIKFTNWGHICQGCTELILDDVRLYTLAELTPLVPHCTLGIDNTLDSQNMTSVSPNLVTNELNVKTNSNKLLEIILFDITSRKLLQQTFISSVSLNTEQLAKGIYLYEVRNKNGVIKKGKVVKE
ncbi:MAG: T9SS type A sorting domain-containing protein [Bacteroidia bacterium]